ncbi:TetR family transcriptional regulator C-terminal domain-containing protein [Jannaschia sp. S6380]|uniref:TetR family transcriptional regulator C-terminal domain-containing protein n=1 Tax=Jannaschia sp. S6380 TaxID=2926408 RepID=UPI001FF59FFE|nr:TetR family transcriptional regulator C-terminal domain-containing protein [Jannaschia sp. S6380]MCK0167445.1 TetR family transcriptional regulator C-terminal domain-containing protein [Jannaschia sp. S6380]
MAKDDGPTRIQRDRRLRILEAGLDVFAAEGFRGATLDGIARQAGLSKPNLLYYFASKEAIFRALLDLVLDTWLDPLRALDPQGEPLREMLEYVRRKLRLARDHPRESRLFAGEILHGAPRLGDALSVDLKRLVDGRAGVIAGWMARGRLAPSDPHHLIFSIWALTQHYADFDVQVRAVLGPDRDPWAEAEAHLTTHFTRLLTP